MSSANQVKISSNLISAALAVLLLSSTSTCVFGEEDYSNNDSLGQPPFLSDNNEAIDQRLQAIEEKVDILFGQVIKRNSEVRSESPSDDGNSPDRAASKDDSVQESEIGKKAPVGEGIAGEKGPEGSVPSDKNATTSRHRPKPGQFDVDEESAQRALERTLVQQGALLLAAGDVEFETALSYERDVLRLPASFQRDEQSFLATDEYRSNTVDLSVTLRSGLPYDSQIELGFPYRYIDRSVVTRVGFEEAAAIDQQGQGIGDVSLGLAKTLLREKKGRPDLILRLIWDSSTGDEKDGNVSLGGGGNNEYIASLSLTKRQDPLVFTANVSYQQAERFEGILPGKRLSVSIGTLLAASPETSLRMTFNQTFIDKIEVDGNEVDGSDRTVASLSLGASSIIGRRSFLNTSVVAGLTDDATDYTVSFTYTRRFIGLLSF